MKGIRFELEVRLLGKMDGGIRLESGDAGA